LSGVGTDIGVAFADLAMRKETGEEPGEERIAAAEVVFM